MATVQELLHKFHKVADAPKEQMKKYLGDNKKIILCSPVYTPEEVIHAMGLIPFGAWGADMEIKEAKTYFPAFICSIMQSVLELGMTGAYEGVSAIVIPSLCDSLKCLGENWKYAVPQIEFIPMVYPQNRNSDFGREFTKAGYQKVIAALEKIAGKSFRNEDLLQSIQVYNEHNQAMRQMADCISAYPVITASDRNAIFKSAYFMEKAEHTLLVNQLMEELNKTHKTQGSKLRIVTSGILADAKQLLEILEENQMQIVADDIAHESRQYRVDSKKTDNGLDSLADKFANMNNCSVLFDVNKGRADFITNMAKEKRADGVLVVLTKFCDPEEFDYVIIKGACEEKGIPLLKIEVDRQMENYEQVRTAVQTFAEMMK